MRNYIYPGNVLSWRFAAPAKEDSVAIIIPEGTPDHMRIIAYNLDDKPVAAQMTGWEIDPGQWEIRQSTQAADNAPLAGTTTRTASFERSRSLDVTFAPHTTTVIELTLKQKGTPYWSRPDLGIDPEDVKIEGRRIAVTVHSLGAVDAPSGRVVVHDRNGRTLATARIPALKAPTDLQPKIATVSLPLPTKALLDGASITIESSGDVPEITLMNNTVPLPLDAAPPQ